MMKKLFAALVAGFMMFSLAACGTDSSVSESETSATTEKSETSNMEASEPDMLLEESSGSETNSEQQSIETDSLVVYFSWSGNTESVAKEIQIQTGADIFEIVPTVPYSDDYNTVVDLAQEEQDNNIRPEINGQIDNLDQYETIYVGYPNWWGDMPMILYTFFDTYDLSGKTILPFCTSGGSGLSNTVSEIASLEPETTVLDGLHIGDSSLDHISEDVETWLADSGM